MANRRVEYERVFENYLRAWRIPYVAVDEARKTLLPRGLPGGPESDAGLKSFDFVIYGEGGNLLADVKGRTAGGGKWSSGRSTGGRLESWVTRDDVESLRRWEGLFGPGFEAVFVFVYRCPGQPPDALFQEVISDGGLWYALRAVRVCEYAAAMRPRSPKWRTVDVEPRVFERISGPFAPPVPMPAARGPLRGAGWREAGWAGDSMDALAGPEVPVLRPLTAASG